MGSAIVLRSRDVGDFSSRNRHDYSVTLTLEEIAEITGLIAKAKESTRRGTVAKHMTPVLRELLRIVSICVDEPRDI
jgi:hypothetical protein